MYIRNVNPTTNLLLAMHTIPCERRVGRWDPYYSQTCQRGCSALVTEALRHVDRHGHAVDLGAGAMNDTLHLLDSGFDKVTAVDASTGSIEYANKASTLYGRRFEFVNGRFCDFPFQTESSDLVHANFSLPYHGRVGFESLVEAATESVRVGGVFSSTFFGTEDGWAETKPDIPLLAEAEVRSLFGGFEFKLFREHKLDGHLFGNEGDSPAKVRKFWHYFQVIALRVRPVL